MDRGGAGPGSEDSGRLNLRSVKNHAEVIPMKTLSLLATTILSLCAPLCEAQNIVEYSTGAARAGATAGASSAGKAVGGVFGSLSKTLEKTQASESSEPARSSTVRESGQPSVTEVTSSPKAAAPVRLKPLKPEEVQIGMLRADLIQQFGRPLMKTSKMAGATYQEVFYYQHPEEDMTVVILREGKVATVNPPANPETSPKSEQR